MTLTVNYLGQLRNFAGVESESRDVESGDVMDVIRSLGDAYGEDFARVLLADDGSLRPSVMILVNDNPVQKDALPALNDGDRLTLMTAIAGG